MARLSRFDRVRSVSVGNGPIDTSNSSNDPGGILLPVQVIFETASVTCPSSVVFCTVAVQPGTARVCTDAIGWSMGRVRFQLRGGRVVALIGNPEGHLGIAALLCGMGVDRDVRPRDAGEGEQHHGTDAADRGNP